MRIRFENQWGKARTVFRKGDFQESCEPLDNPGRGWYHIYTFEARPPADGRPVAEEVWLDEACREEQLALALIDIGAFQEEELSQEALAHIGQILDFFRNMGKQIILRFVYDRLGEGTKKEPSAIALVKRHMEQVGVCVRPYADDILVIQGIFVGNWGEMHGSKFLDGPSIRELVHTLYRATEGKCFLAVRTPRQWRSVMARPGPPGLAKRLALYNDGMFGSATDLGTYGSGEPTAGGARGRRAELEWQDIHVAAVPNGGEALYAAPPIGCRQAAEELGKMHVNYLNSVYHPRQLEHWKGERIEEPGCFAGLSGFDCIGRRLGYRFVVRDVTDSRGWGLRITVENRGFGNLCEEADCLLLTQEADGAVTSRRLAVDARNWRSGEKTVLSIKPSRRSGRLFLLLRRARDGRIIRFANQGAEEKLLLGEYSHR